MVALILAAINFHTFTANDSIQDTKFVARNPFSEICYEELLRFDPMNQ